MAPRNPHFSKKTSTTYALVARPQHDPRINDDEAPSHVFTQISGPSSSSQNPPHEKQRNPKVKQRGDLDEEFGLSGGLRANEGEAAEYGIFYDDSGYDYMQHLRDLGGGSGGEVAWVEAPRTSQKEKKGKGKKLEDALREVKLEEETAQDVGATSILERGEEQQVAYLSYQDQQDIPDALAGFQPDMDPRLREVLEALDDEAYVDDEGDIFEELAADGKAEEMDHEEWEATGLGDTGDEEGWESDRTTRPLEDDQAVDADDSTLKTPQSSKQTGEEAMPQLPSTDGDWFANFAKSKGNTLDNTALAASRKPPDPGSLSIAPSGTSALSGRAKKRKGALTSSAGFSMTSSSLARTDTLSTLDSRFEKLAASYMDDIDEEADGEMDDATSAVSGASVATGRSSRWGNGPVSGGVRLAEQDEEEVPELTSAKVTSVMDEFLSGAGGAKRRLMKKGGRPGVWGAQSGLDQLDEIRKGLGPARLGSRKQQSVPV